MTPSTAPLTGPRVLLTRSDDDCAEWAERLVQRGARPISLPCIRCDTLDTPALRSALAAAVPSADWLAFTSRRGVEAFARLYAAPLAGGKVAVVGAATAAAARERLGRADIVGSGTAAELAAVFVASGALAEHPHVLLAVAANAGDVLEHSLTAAGASCTRFDVYRTLPAPPAAMKRAMSSLGADNVLFASPTAVTGFVQQVVMDVAVNIYTIGPSTTAAARAHGLRVTAEAREPSLEGILEAMQWQK